MTQREKVTSLKIGFQYKLGVNGIVLIKRDGEQDVEQLDIKKNMWNILTDKDDVEFNDSDSVLMTVGDMITKNLTLIELYSDGKGKAIRADTGNVIDYSVYSWSITLMRNRLIEKHGFRG